MKVSTEISPIMASATTRLVFHVMLLLKLYLRSNATAYLVPTGVAALKLRRAQREEVIVIMTVTVQEH